MNKELKLTQGEVWPLPSSPARCSLGRLSVYLRALGHRTSALPLKHLKSIYVCSQPCLHIKSPGPQGLGEGPSLTIFCAHIIAREVKTVHDSMVRGYLRAPWLEASWTLPMYLFPWLILICILYSFTAVKP